MQVFLSWSGDYSREVVQVISKWLRQVIQAVQPWNSGDIPKGHRWGPKITEKLRASPVGIIVLTRDNLSAHWLLFEAGAISNLEGSHVCTLLVDVEATDVKDPLAQFQNTTLGKKEDMLKLVKVMNEKVAEEHGHALSESELADSFENNWSRLESSLSSIELPSAPALPPRDNNELLKEILEILRTQERRESEREDQLRRELLAAALLCDNKAGVGMKRGAATPNITLRDLFELPPRQEAPPE